MSQTLLARIVACTQTLFHFSFRSFQKHRRAPQQSKRARTSPTTTPLRWRSINPLRFKFYHPRSTDFEENIEGL